MLERITKLKRVPEIGEWFSVPCYPMVAGPRIIRGRHKRRHKIIGEWMCPVLLRAHEDSKLLNFPLWHYHIDFRFFTNNTINFYFKSQLMGSDIYPSLDERIDLLQNTICIILTKGNKPDFERVVWKDMMYRRHWEQKSSLPQLEKRFKDKPLNCLTCRHKGVNLADQPVVNGIVTCPAHGLKWNVSHLKDQC